MAILSLNGGKNLVNIPEFTFGTTTKQSLAMPETMGEQMIRMTTGGIPALNNPGLSLGDATILPTAEITATPLNAFGLDTKTTYLIGGIVALALAWYFFKHKKG